MRRAAKVDANQADIVEALRGIPGCSVLVLSAVGGSCPDILLGYRGANLLVELKNPDVYYNPKLPTMVKQAEFRKNWKGQVLQAYSLTEILAFMTGYEFSAPRRDGTDGTKPAAFEPVRSSGEGPIL